MESAYREVVGALAAMLRCLNQQVAALEQQLAVRLGAHRDAAILRSLPGLGAVLGARVLGEFGDDPHRNATAKAGGRLLPVGVRRADRLTGGRGAAMTPTAPAAPPTITRCGRWATGWWASARLPGPPGGLPGAAGLAGRRTGRLTTPAGGAGGVQPLGVLAIWVALTLVVRVGR